MSQYLSEHEPQGEPATGYRSRRRLTTLTIGATLVAILILTALLAPWLAPFDPNLQHIELRLLPPSSGHWLGTDGFGRSENRVALRDFFEVDAKHIVLATLSALARENQIKIDTVQQAVKDLGINPEKPNPAIS